MFFFVGLLVRMRFKVVLWLVLGFWGLSLILFKMCYLTFGPTKGPFKDFCLLFLDSLSKCLFFTWCLLGFCFFCLFFYLSWMCFHASLGF